MVDAWHCKNILNYAKITIKLKTGPCIKIAHKIGHKKIVLSGGCFQNAVLLERVINKISKNGYKVYRHQRIPPNDGGISLGQVVIANQMQNLNL